MKKQKINFIIGNINTIGGVETVTRTLAQEFLARGAIVQLHSLYSTKLSTPLTSDFSITHYELIPPDQEKGRFLKMMRGLRNGLIILKQSHHFSGHFIFQGFYTAIYLPFFKIPSRDAIVCEHNSHTAPGKLSQLVRKFLYRSFNPKVLVLSEQDKTYFKDAGLEKVFKVYNPCPFEASFTHHPTKNLIALGRFTSQKRFDLMVKACAPLLQSYPDWKLLIQGDGEDKQLIEQTIQEQKNRTQFEIIPMGSPLRLYQQGSIYLMTSNYEGLPMVLIEAMSFGIPIVAMNCPGGLSEIIEDGKNGFLTPHGSIESFVEKVKALIENEGLRETLGNNAKESIKKFSKESIMNTWEDILK